MSADVIPIGSCESCGRSKIIWEVEVMDDDMGHTTEIYRVCWDCVDPALEDAIKESGQ